MKTFLIDVETTIRQTIAVEAENEQVASFLAEQVANFNIDPKEENGVEKRLRLLDAELETAEPVYFDETDGDIDDATCLYCSEWRNREYPEENDDEEDDIEFFND